MRCTTRPGRLAACLFSILLTVALEAGALDGPYPLDMAAAVNRAAEDDGIAGNGEGGWTDEGINDMYMYPAVPRGEFRRNGHVFRTDAAGRVIMLQGSKHHSGFAKSATLPVPDLKARYIYVMQQSAGFPAQAGETVATYTIHYADGTTATREIRQGREIMHWWQGQWFANAGPGAWPVVMGRNSYSRKWSQYIGIWAMRWENPQPDKVMTALHFESAGKATPVIWAVTLADTDFHADAAALKEHFVRPDEGDDAYFEPKLAVERASTLRLMQAAGWADGVIGAEMIAPDLLAVTLDAAANGGPGPGEALAASYQTPTAWTLSSATDAALDGRQPTAVGRNTIRVWSGDIGPFPMTRVYHHTYYLRLATPLQAGATYTIAVDGLPAGTKRTAIELTHDSLQSETRVIKVNQHGYAPAARSRYAYLGWWAADLGAVDYSAYETAEIRDAAAPERVLATLPITDRVASPVNPKDRVAAGEPDPASGELIRQIDLAGITAPGDYFIHVPGLGRSVDFALRPEAPMAAARATARSLLHQRCGAELTPESTRFPRPICHTHTYRSGKLVYGIEERWQDGERVVQNPPQGADDPIRQFSGGYHDAGDYDLFYYHFLGTADMLTAFEYGTPELQALDLNLPERESALPDLLDEAIWALTFYVDTQAEDGAVAAGRTNDEDYVRKNWPLEWQKDFGGKLPEYGVLPPCQQSSLAFAAVAAQLARCLAPYDSDRAAFYRERAARALHWAQTAPSTKYELEGPSYIRLETPHLTVWATAELYKTTGADADHDRFLAANADMDATQITWRQHDRLALYLWPYASTELPQVDPALRQRYRDTIIKEASLKGRQPAHFGYRLSSYRIPGGWGNLAGGGRAALTALRAWLLTGDPAHYDTASLNADFQLGANPLSRSFITGLGERAPIHPEVRGILTHGPHDPAAGIAVFGIGGGPKSLPGAFPAERPAWRCWMDDPVSAIHSEFVVERLGREAAFYLLLAGGQPIADAAP